MIERKFDRKIRKKQASKARPIVSIKRERESEKKK